MYLSDAGVTSHPRGQARLVEVNARLLAAGVDGCPARASRRATLVILAEEDSDDRQIITQILKEWQPTASNTVQNDKTSVARGQARCMALNPKLGGCNETARCGAPYIGRV
jgi:endonuclease III